MECPIIHGTNWKQLIPRSTASGKWKMKVARTSPRSERIHFNDTNLIEIRFRVPPLPYLFTIKFYNLTFMISLEKYSEK